MAQPPPLLEKLPRRLWPLHQCPYNYYFMYYCVCVRVCVCVTGKAEQAVVEPKKTEPNARGRRLSLDTVLIIIMITCCLCVVSAL